MYVYRYTLRPPGSPSLLTNEILATSLLRGPCMILYRSLDSKHQSATVAELRSQGHLDELSPSDRLETCAPGSKRGVWFLDHPSQSKILMNGI